MCLRVPCTCLYSLLWQSWCFCTYPGPNTSTIFWGSVWPRIPSLVPLPLSYSNTRSSPQSLTTNLCGHSTRYVQPCSLVPGKEALSVCSVSSCTVKRMSCKCVDILLTSCSPLPPPLPPYLFRFSPFSPVLLLPLLRSSPLPWAGDEEWSHGSNGGTCRRCWPH